MNVVIVKRVNNHYFKILRETLTLFLIRNVENVFLFDSIKCGLSLSIEIYFIER
jgi:hypothetical protein